MKILTILSLLFLIFISTFSQWTYETTLTCHRHIYSLRSPFNDKSEVNYPFINSEIISSGKMSNTDCNFKIKMTLPKYYYKKYEPVIAEFELINNESSPVKIYNLFDSELHETNIYISDNLGNIWNTNKEFLYPSLVHKPHYVVNTGDTFTISMPINNWGAKPEKNKFSENDWYFNQLGYFPPGRKYKAFFYFGENNIEEYGCELSSNEVEFEVVDLDEEDSQLLRMYKNETKDFKYNTLDNIINVYPNNDFTEHIIAEYLLHKYGIINWIKKYNSDDVKIDYEHFFSKYPESLYILNHKLLKAYFNYFKLLKDTKEEVFEKIENNLVKKTAKWLLK